MNPKSTPARSLTGLIAELQSCDCTINYETIEAILGYGESAVSHLEGILAKALEAGPDLKQKTSANNTEWFVVIHALYLLAHLKSKRSLPLILRFLSQDQEILDHWLHDLVPDDVWEIIFMLGKNQLNTLQDFVLEEKNNVNSRFAVCTALIQIALHYPSRHQMVVEIFKDVLFRAETDSDFTGLLINELTDLRDGSLKPTLLNMLRENQVWQGFISAQELELVYRHKRPRKVTPLALYDRYEYFKQHAYFSKTASESSLTKEHLRKLEKSIPSSTR